MLDDKMESRIILPALLLISVLFISGCTSQSIAAKYAAGSLPANIEPTNEGQLTPEGSSVGNKAPDFNLTTTDGRTIRLSELTKEKKPVVLYFMATWCPYCKQEYDEIEKVFPKFGGAEFISVSIDLNENAEALEKYRTSYNRPGLFAPGNEAILKDYNVIYTTTKYVISKDGVILYKGSGVLTSDNWKIIFDSLQ